MAAEGYGAASVEKTYNRARQLCRQIGGTPEIFPVLRGLYVTYLLQGQLQAAHELAEQLLNLAEKAQEPGFLVEAHFAVGQTFFFLGDLVAAQSHEDQATALYDLDKHRHHAFAYGQDPGVFSLALGGLVRWLLGCPEQASMLIQHAISLAKTLSHPNSLCAALGIGALVHCLRRDSATATELARQLIASSVGFPFWSAWGDILGGFALDLEQPCEAGISTMRLGLEAYRATGAELNIPLWTSFLCEGYRKGRRVAAGDGRKLCRAGRRSIHHAIRGRRHRHRHD
jgi:adenylate cyclase